MSLKSIDNTNFAESTHLIQNENFQFPKEKRTLIPNKELEEKERVASQRLAAIFSGKEDCNPEQFHALMSTMTAFLFRKQQHLSKLFYFESGLHIKLTVDKAYGTFGSKKVTACTLTAFVANVGGCILSLTPFVAGASAALSTAAQAAGQLGNGFQHLGSSVLQANDEAQRFVHNHALEVLKQFRNDQHAGAQTDRQSEQSVMEQMRRASETRERAVEALLAR